MNEYIFLSSNVSCDGNNFGCFKEYKILILLSFYWNYFNSILVNLHNNYTNSLFSMFPLVSIKSRCKVCVLPKILVSNLHYTISMNAFREFVKVETTLGRNFDFFFTTIRFSGRLVRELRGSEYLSLL